MAKKLDGQDLAARYQELLAKKQADPNGKGLTTDELKEFRKLESLISKTPKLGNDFGWWSKVPVLLRDAANLTTNWIAGTMLARRDITYTPYGVVAIHLLSTYGSNASATDPINVWSRDLYLRMFQKWRGISAYGASDLGIAIIAELEFLKGVDKAERIYGIVNRYSKRNVNMPYLELAALGINQTMADSIRDHLSDYRYDLNALIRRAQRLCIPKDIALIANSHSLEGCEYLDHDNDKAQIILFTYDEMGEYSDTFLQSGGSIAFTNVTNMGGFIDFTQDNCFPILSRALDNLMNSDSVQKILGDLVTWFGEEQMLQLLPLPEDYIVAPVYAESMLHKMHNLECLPFNVQQFPLIHSIPATGLTAADVTALKGSLSRRIYQVGGSNIYTKASVCFLSGGPTWYSVNGTEYRMNSTSFNAYIHQSHCLDTYRVSPTDETIVEGSLWKYGVEDITNNVSGTTYHAYEISPCFEVVCEVVLWKNFGTGPVSHSITNSVTATAATAYSEGGYVSILDWAPLMYVVQQSSGIYVITDIVGDIDTPIVINQNALDRIHTACIYSGLQTDVRVIAK